MNLLLPPRIEKGHKTPASLGSAWLRRAPWAGLAVLIASGAYLALFYRDPLSSSDEGLIATAAERILRGQIPYRDFFSELGPGSFYLQAAIFKVGGINLSSVRITVWLLGVMISGLIFCLGERLMSRPMASLPSLVFVTICYPHNYQESHHWWSTLFVLLMVLSLSPQAKQTWADHPDRSELLLPVAGLLGGATALCMQPKGAWAVVTALAWLVVVDWRLGVQTRRVAVRRRARQALYLLLGIGATAGLMAGYLWARGALRPWVQDNLVFLFTNYLPYVSAPNTYSWVRFTRLMCWLLKERSEQAFLNVAGFYFFCLVGPAVAFGGAAWQVSRGEQVEPPRRRLLLLYLLVGLGSLFSELHHPDAYHFLFSAPLMLILLPYSCLCAYRRWSWLRWPLRAVAGVALIFVVLGARRAVAHAVSLKVQIPCRRGVVYRDEGSPPMLRQWIQTIENVVPAGEETFIFPYDAHLYFLTGTQNPSRYDVLLAGFHSPQQIEEAIWTLQVRRPKYIFSFDPIERLTARGHLPDDEPDIQEMHPVERFLRQSQGLYRLQKEVEGLEVWSLKK